MRNYVVLHDNVGAYSKGEIVPGIVFADGVKRLLDLGAIGDTDAEPTVAAVNPLTVEFDRDNADAIRAGIGRSVEASSRALDAITEMADENKRLANQAEADRRRAVDLGNEMNELRGRVGTLEDDNRTLKDQLGIVHTSKPVDWDENDPTGEGVEPLAKHRTTGPRPSGETPAAAIREPHNAAEQPHGTPGTVPVTVPPHTEPVTRPTHAPAETPRPTPQQTPHHPAQTPQTPKPGTTPKK